MPKVVIGIQARSDSVRFPGKVLKKIEGEKILDTIIKTCKKSADFLNRQPPVHKNGADFSNYDVSVHLLTPTNDPINEIYKDYFLVHHEETQDVLSRYIKLEELTQPDQIVRITADCYHMPSYMISRAIKTAVIKNSDYTSNVIYRTSCEGFDVEIISPKMLRFLDEMTKDDNYLREHVTLYLYNNILENPEYFKRNFKVWHLFENYDFSSIKTSIDTPHDFLIAERNVKSVKLKRFKAMQSGYVSAE